MASLLPVGSVYHQLDTEFNERLRQSLRTRKSISNQARLTWSLPLTIIPLLIAYCLTRDYVCQH